MTAASTTILIAAGGTGGHIFPALAIAKELRRQQPKWNIYFVGTAHGLENQLVPPQGFSVLQIPIGRLNRNVAWSERLLTVLKMPLALVMSLLIVVRHQPKFVLGVGGHASGPLLFMAAMLGYRTIIWEPNAMPGLANRWLAPFVSECLVVFASAAQRMKRKKWQQVGMPVRAEIEATTPRPREPNRPLRILVFGGSQGARGINNVVAEAVKTYQARLQDVEIVHQTGAQEFARVQDLYGAAVNRVVLKDFIHNMAEMYAWADLVIARSGTGTLSELAACGKAAVLVPFPFASDNHQQKNAEVLANARSAIMILQKDFHAERFCQLIEEFKSHPELIDQYSKNIQKFHRPKATEHIVKLLLPEVLGTSCD